MILPKKFYVQNVHAVAKELLGCRLVRVTKKGVIKSIITETESYEGAEDLASHAKGGKVTERNKIMYGPAGVWYVYLVYGMHNMLNVVTGIEGDPQAVLIRAVVDAEGPGKLTKYYDIDRRFNGQPISKTSGLYVERGPTSFKGKKIVSLPRVGVSYAGPEWGGKLYRYRLEI